jgi:uncharacterized membrane protein YuzA (DUF378 family)
MSGKAKIGATISLDGEKEYKQAISEINKALSVLGSEMKKVTAQFDGNANSIDGLNAKQDVLERKLLTQKDKVDILKKALQESAEKYGEASSKTQDYQIKLNNAEAELLKTEKAIRETTEQLNKMGNEADQAGDKTKVMSNDLKTATTNTEKLDKAQNALRKTLNVVKIAAAAVAAAIGALAVSSVNAADELQEMADKSGISAEELQALKYAGDNLGVSLETITGSRAKLTRAMNEARDGEGEAAEIFRKMGIYVEGTNGQLRNATDVMLDVIERAYVLGNETEQDAAMMTLFGRSAQELNPLLRAGSDEIKRLGDEARSTGAVMSNETISALDNMKDKLNNLKTTIVAKFGEALAKLAPQITALIERITQKLSQVDFTPIITAVMKIIENLPKIITLIGTLGAAFLAFKGVQVITSLVGAFSSLTGATAAASAGIAAMAGPIGLVAAAVAGLGLGVGILAAKNEWFTGKNKKQYEYWPATPNMNTDVYGPSLPAQQNQALPAQQNQASQKVYTPANSPYQVTVPLSLNMDGREVARQSFSFNLAEGNIRGLQLVQ